MTARDLLPASQHQRDEQEEADEQRQLDQDLQALSPGGEQTFVNLVADRDGHDSRAEASVAASGKRDGAHLGPSLPSKTAASPEGGPGG